MSEKAPPPGTEKAVCPDCRLEMTGSKLVERQKPHDPHQPEHEVYWCPECGRFFSREADASAPRS